MRSNKPETLPWLPLPRCYSRAHALMSTLFYLIFRLPIVTPVLITGGDWDGAIFGIIIVICYRRQNYQRQSSSLSTSYFHCRHCQRHIFIVVIVNVNHRHHRSSSSSSSSSSVLTLLLSSLSLTIRPVALSGYGSMAHEAKPNGLLIRSP